MGLAAPPLIGLSTYRESASWGVWSEPADLLPASYADAIAAAGAVPLLLPPAAGRPSDAAEAAVSVLDGLLLSGGPDVDPGQYGAARDPHTGPPRFERDDWEIALIGAALQRGIAVLGVCRGMQLLAVALGGTLVQHLPDALGTQLHCPAPGVHGRHQVRLAEDSRLAAILGPQTSVATYHHQAVERLPETAIAAAWADDDTIEAFELPGPAWAIGVQWHPEAHDGTALFAGFVGACARERVSST